MKTFDEMLEYNLTKTRYFKIPEIIKGADQRHAWWMDKALRQSAKEVYNELKVEIERLEEIIENLKNNPIIFKEGSAPVTIHNIPTHSTHIIRKV